MVVHERSRQVGTFDTARRMRNVSGTHGRARAPAPAPRASCVRGGRRRASLGRVTAPTSSSTPASACRRGRPVPRAGRAVEDHRRPPHLPLAARRVRRRAHAGRAVVLHEAADDAERPPAACCAGRAARGSSTTRASSPSSSGARMKGVPDGRRARLRDGFAPANDVGLHDFRHADRGSMLRVKGQDGFLPIGPAVVTADEWTPDGGYTLRTYLNGEVVQEADQDDLIWDYRYQLADLCRTDHARARRRDPHGHAGQRRPMQPGDVVAVEICGLGRLENTVVDWDVDLTRPGRPARGLAEHAPRRARDPRGRGGAAWSRRGACRDRACAASTTSACASPTSTRRARRWALQFGLTVRDAARTARDSWPATTSRTRSSSCEPRRREPGLRPLRPGELRRSCSLDDARAHLRRARRARSTSASGVLVRSPTPRASAPAVPRSSASDDRRAGDRTPDDDAAGPPSAQARPRQLPHGRWQARVGFYTRRAGHAVTDYLGERRRVAARQRRPPRDGAGRQGPRALPPPRVRPRRLRHAARACSTTSAQHGRWLGWGPVRHGIGQQHLRLRAHPRGAAASSSSTSTWSCSSAEHEPRHWPDDRFSSNTWGPLPPRSYFRFDEAAIASERESLETRAPLGEPAPHLRPRRVSLQGYSLPLTPGGPRRSSRRRRGTTSATSW